MGNNIDFIYRVHKMDLTQVNEFINNLQSNVPPERRGEGYNFKYRILLARGKALRGINQKQRS